MRPVLLSDIVGQRKIKQTLRIMINSAISRKDALGHTLIVGPSGRGKTTIARVIAKEMASGQPTRMHYINGGLIKKPVDIMPLLTQKIQHGEVLFIDEIHSIPLEIAEWLYIVMEDFIIIGTNGSKIDLPRFTIVGATTHVGLLPKPFKDRFKYVAELEDYTEEDLLQIAQKYIKDVDINLSDEALSILVKTSRFTPRLILGRIDFIRDYIVSENLSKVEAKDILSILEMLGVDQDGLTDMDRKYLEILKCGKAISLRQIAAKIDAKEVTIQNEIEPFLLKLNKIEITNKGRQIVLPVFDYGNLM